MPYAGAVRASGRTPAQVQQSIVDALRNRAIEPQAVVALVEQRTSLISVLGEVNTPARLPASAAGEKPARVLRDVRGIAQAKRRQVIEMTKRARRRR